MSPHWAEKLAHLILESKDIDGIWEIGPGLGAITKKILDKTELPLTVFEIDPKLCQHLREIFPSLNIREGDILEVDFEKEAENKKIGVLSNLPYHLSSPILFELVKIKKQLSHCVLTFQKEFAERLVASPSTKNYGALTVLINQSFKIASIGIVPHGAFYPEPSIDSQALLLTPRLETAPENFAGLVKLAFSHRRKKLSSNLAEKYPKNLVEEILQSLGFGVNTRPEELSRENYLILSRGVLKP
jgi:16S rRNA (adenine1518-N6/adenine1519-N6)-dimethyltransferase